ncbi:hypothetical protein [Sulfurimicrobium lacus]|nr:hypothetical protein [Sulfurimicrobium lacus]
MSDDEIRHISEIFPTSLDSIITKRRDEIELHLTTAAEIEELQTDIFTDHEKDTIDDWRLITMEGLLINQRRIMLLGDSRILGHAWITSRVRQIDLQRNVLVTSNSIYKLGLKGEGEPNIHHLIAVCAALTRWGSGEALGVTPFFY